MSNLDYSVDNYRNFIDHVEENKIAEGSKLANWKSVLNVLSVLTAEEEKDITKFEIQELLDIFKARKIESGKEPSAGSLGTYKSRLNKGLSEFKKYVENASKAQNNDMVKKTETNREDKANVIENKIETYTLPFPLRAGVMVKISDLPTNLTAEEAERIASMVKALVNEK
ncbi:hypothetical protein [Vibrio aestuarianus]|uniref:Phage protein n=1 Tax=Vibrio aestuarianus TaxID=28171 RepID=A0ABN8TVP7_9VIBR|nr:hypothetical protein [Vibrio aestuarianus]MDE1215587.1 hypothetical protein [Vibrio aestuarianus]MDE1218651.1 hypothetical protein [Vibrio aestuarianus]MDE1258069.1 hypothetical protein [Vibrio aestuarianus]MDE1262409.1 hypothetical protein [Vibrio aestuarianus]MDE1269823.1 hypothetical protein [Vibrio aestuarianus]